MKVALINDGPVTLMLERARAIGSPVDIERQRGP